MTTTAITFNPPTTLPDPEDDVLASVLRDDGTIEVWEAHCVEGVWWSSNATQIMAPVVSWAHKPEGVDLRDGHVQPEPAKDEPVSLRPEDVHAAFTNHFPKTRISQAWIGFAADIAAVVQARALPKRETLSECRIKSLYESCPSDADGRFSLSEFAHKVWDEALGTSQSAQPDMRDIEIAGLKSSIGHLSTLVDSMRALLVDVEDVCGRDGHGGPLEDGESSLIDRVRQMISTVAEPAQPCEVEPKP